ncbi:hypothetical protein [Wenzhouxiangella limi]|uniref:Uncharacterized protein n=1 Tax=Wenzhouxiangella limi TaxID=2707351 RepID=A0A845UYT8_9GAMM|nr:hypothetical protein [Wenzhouxiangella limi]NDY95050.1 hypothetical protein [Wenzhouxiangella limi]
MSTEGKKSRFRDRIDKTLAEERDAVQERFSKADIALGNREKENTRRKNAPAKKVVRDNFSMPEEDYALIEEIRQRLIREHALARNKSEVLRAGLIALTRMDSADLAEAISQVVILKPGRKSE